jgi:hypothetical protein
MMLKVCHSTSTAEIGKILYPVYSEFASIRRLHNVEQSDSKMSQIGFVTEILNWGLDAANPPTVSCAVKQCS